jgi:D-glycero-alpha-D-manno-heptose 1-phosphate guanylyltransferase
MEAIILAGGFGTRLRSVVPDLPKPMAPIAGRPFLEILLGRLSSKGFTHVILSVGYKSEIITNHFGNQFKNLALDYAIEDSPLGTGGAVRLAMEKATHNHAYVFNGDTYLDLEVDQAEQGWLQSPNPKIVGCEVPDTSRYGRLISDGDKVIGFTEKGISGVGLINAGCYILPRHCLDNFSLGENFSLETQYLAPNVCQRNFDLFLTKGKFLDIGIPEDYARAQTELAGL